MAVKKPPFKIGTLGEIAIRCENIKVMSNFYQDVLGLQIMSGTSDEGIIFFKLSEGFSGHATVLALFAKDTPNQRGVHPISKAAPVTGANSSLHHMALSLSYIEQEKAITWYEEIGQDYSIENFTEIGWRGVFTNDPEGNTVELVAKAPD